MEKEIYVIEPRNDFSIKKCKIVKETEKTYVINQDSGWGNQVVRKGEMKTWNGVVVIGYDEALNTRTKLIKQRIELNDMRICEYSKDNERLNKLLGKE